jgi:hypothetical protein
MRYLTLFTFSATMLAQIYVYDVDGRRVLLPAPEEKRERKVVEDGPNGRVIEETIERRDVNGNKLPPEKVRVVEKQGADGSQVVETTTFRSDLNGRLTPAERAVVTTQQQSGQRVTTSIIERPTVNGSFAAVEKMASQTTAADGKERTNRSTYVLDPSGRFVEAVRELIEKAPEGSGAKEVTQEFRNAPTGKMELAGQKIKIDTPNADGSSTSEITIYGAVAPGRTADGNLRLREQQLVTTRPGPGNTLVESISLRRPDLSDSKLGAYQKVGEKVIQLPKGGAGKP